MVCLAHAWYSTWKIIVHDTSRKQSQSHVRSKLHCLYYLVPETLLVHITLLVPCIAGTGTLNGWYQKLGVFQARYFHAEKETVISKTVQNVSRFSKVTTFLQVINLPHIVTLIQGQRDICASWNSTPPHIPNFTKLPIIAKIGLKVAHMPVSKLNANPR